MSCLLLVGNVNQYTFANAILAAHVHARARDAEGLKDIFVLHSPESERFLGEHGEWRAHLLAQGHDSISPEVFTTVSVDLTGGQRNQLSLVARHVDRFLRPLDQREDVYVDLTNGTSHYKSVLANIAFVIGARRPFILNSAARGFLDAADLCKAYVELPDPALLDSLAPVWLTEVRRFNHKSQQAADTMSALGQSPDGLYASFRDDMRNAIHDWFRGEKQNDGAALGGAVRHVGRAFEDMIRLVYGTVFPDRSGSRKTAEEMLRHILDHLACTVTDYDPELLGDVSQLLRRLRNASTHGSHAAEFGRVRARLATELLLAATELFGILNQRGLLKPAGEVKSGATTQYGIEGQRGEIYFFGLDGDDTGRELERLFQGNFEPSAFTRFSKSVDGAIKAIADQIKEPPISGQVLFCSGDDLLFKGHYDHDAIETLRATYNRKSGGQTCSVGYGRTPKDAYVALKIAKASPGKDAVMGVEIV